MSTRSTTKFPLRFRRAEERGRRITRLLKFMGRVRGVDGALIERLGRALLERDELGHSSSANWPASFASPSITGMIGCPSPASVKPASVIFARK